MKEQNSIEWLSSSVKLPEAKEEDKPQETRIVFAVNDNGKERDATPEEAEEFESWCR